MASLNNNDLKATAREQKKQGDLDGAVKSLENAIDATARELSDLHGMLGGTRKMQGKFAAAAAEYDAGYRLDTHFNNVSSYNDLNRLVTRVLLCPAALSDSELLRQEQTVEYLDLSLELSCLENDLQHQMAGARSNDYWAAGDLAVTAALNGHLETASAAVEKFVSFSPPPPDTAFDAYINVLDELSLLGTPCSEILQGVKSLLERKSRAD